MKTMVKRPKTVYVKASSSRRALEVARGRYPGYTASSPVIVEKTYRVKLKPKKRR